MLLFGLIVVFLVVAAWRGGWLQMSVRKGPEATIAELQARQLLGVGAGASADEIKNAHRRLMAECHPDRGGSIDRAQALNDARQLLLHDAG